MEWSYNWKMLQDKKLAADDATESHPARHQRALRKHVLELERSTSRLKESDRELQNKIKTLELQLQDMQKSSYERKTNELNNQENELFDNEQQQDEQPITERLIHLETLQKNNELSMFNLSQQLSNYDKLHRSMLELLENVESIENKMDKNMPDFRKEISKLEFQMAQVVSKISAMKEDQKNTRESVKAISVSVSNLKDKFDVQHIAYDQLNSTLEKLKETTNVQNSKLHDHILKVRYQF